MFNETLYFLLLLINYPGTYSFKVSSFPRLLHKYSIRSKACHSSPHGAGLCMPYVFVKSNFSENQNKRKRCV